MEESAKSPLKLASEQFPPRWYEKGYPQSSLMGWAGGVALGYLQNRFGPEIDRLAEHISGAGIYLTSALLDRSTTKKVFSAVEEAAGYDIDPGYVEANPLVNEVSSKVEFEKQSKNPKIVALEIGVIGLAAINWQLALPLTAIRGTAVMNNLRKAKRLTFAINQAMTKSPDEL